MKKQSTSLEIEWEEAQRSEGPRRDHDYTDHGNEPKVTTLGSERPLTREQIEELQAQLRAAREEVEELKASNYSAGIVLRQQTAIHARLQREYVVLQRARDELRGKFERRDHDLQALQAELQDLRASTSWRLTKPLRVVVEALRRLKGSKAT